MMRWTPSFRRTSAFEILGDGRQSTAAVDENRDSALDGELEDRLEASVVECERLGAGVELDSSRPEVEAALRLVERIRGQIEADERNEPSARALRVRQRAVVRHAERGLAVVLVHAEDERVREAVLVEDRRELVVIADHPVDVIPEMGVRVEEPRVLGELASEHVVPGVDDRPGPLGRGHERSAFQTRGAVIGSS